MIPTNGRNITLLYLILLTILRNKTLAANVNTKANSIFKKAFVCGISNTLINIPIFAASSVPAVVGDTNLLRVICCIINPQILIPTPVRMIETTLGMRLASITSCLSSSKLNTSKKEISLTPTKMEVIDNTNKRNIYIYLFNSFAKLIF